MENFGEKYITVSIVVVFHGHFLPRLKYYKGDGFENSRELLSYSKNAIFIQPEKVLNV